MKFWKKAILALVGVGAGIWAERKYSAGDKLLGAYKKATNKVGNTLKSCGSRMSCSDEPQEV